MSNILMFTDPSALKWLLLAPVIVLLYMVRSRYRRKAVSSIMLWRSIKRDLESKQQVRLPPFNILMLLQLLAVIVATAALMRPAFPIRDRTHLVVLIDVSTGMQSTDVAPSRFDFALHLARQAIQHVKPGDQISVIQVGPIPNLVVSSTDTTEVLAALDHLRPGAASANASTALQLADSLINLSGGQGFALLISDGSFGTKFQPPDLSIPVEFYPVGNSGQNQGITTVDVRPDADGSDRWSAFARISNYGEFIANITASATADGLLLERKEVSLDPGGNLELSFALPPETRYFGLEITTGDIFQSDDKAEIQLNKSQSRKVLLVSRDAEPIERVLKTIPNLTLTALQPDSYQSSAGADLVIFDGFVPQKYPDADLLILNPPPDLPEFQAQPAGMEASALRSLHGDPLIESVDLQSLRFGQMVRLNTPAWARAILEGQAGPLILEGEISGRKVVVFNFDWRAFDLPRMQAFPLLLSNAVSQLNPMALPRNVRPGSTVQIRPSADSAKVSIEMPDGTHRTLDFDHGAISFDETRQIGRYTVTWKGSKLGEVSSSFNVNVGDYVESNVSPQTYTIGGDRMARNSTTPAPGRQLWPIFALLLLGVMLVEWAYFSRRG